MTSKVASQFREVAQFDELYDDILELITEKYGENLIFECIPSKDEAFNMAFGNAFAGVDDLQLILWAGSLLDMDKHMTHYSQLLYSMLAVVDKEHFESNVELQ